MLQSYAQWLARSRYLVLVMVLLLIGWAAAGIGSLRFKNDHRMFFSEDNPELAAFEQLQNTYTKNDNVLFVLAPKDGRVFTRERLALIEKSTKKAWQIPYSTRVDSVTNFQYSYAEGDHLVVSDLVRDAQEMRDENVARARDIALSDPLLVNRLISPTAHVTGINVIIQRPGDNQQAETRQVATYVRNLQDQIQAEDPGIDVYLTGTVMMDTAFSDAAEHDGTTLTPLMLTIIMVALGWFLRSFVGTFVTVLVIALSIAAALGLSGWVGIALSPSSVLAPTILLTLAVADSVHILLGFYHGITRGLDERAAMAESLKLNMKPVFFTTLTTAVGFLSMNFSDAPPFRDLGNITAMGVGIAFLLSVTLLPALMLILPRAARGATQEHKHRGLIRFADFVIRRHRHWYLGLIVMTGALISFIYQNELNDEFVKYFGPSTDFRRATDFTTDNLTGIYYIDYSLGARQSGGATNPAFLAKVEAFADWYRQQPEVLHVFSITDIFKRLNKNMHGDDPAWYRLPETQELASQYLLLYEMSLPFGLDLNDRINVDKSATRVSMNLKSLSTNEVLALDARARQWLAENASMLEHSGGTGLTMVFAHIGARNITSMISGEVLSIVVISFILMVVLRSVSMGLLSMVPNLVPAAMAFGLWGIIVGRVGLASSVVAAMTLGILVDDTVHFLSKYLHGRREEGLAAEEALRYAFASVGGAIWTTSVVLMAGFALLAFSDFKINAEMGLLTAIIIGRGLYAEFLLLPPLLLGIERIRERVQGKLGRRVSGPINNIVRS